MSKFSYSSFVWIIFIMSHFTCPEGRPNIPHSTQPSSPLPRRVTDYQQFSRSSPPPPPPPLRHHHSLESYHGTNLESSSSSQGAKEDQPLGPHVPLRIEGQNNGPQGVQEQKDGEGTDWKLPTAITRQPILPTLFTQEQPPITGLLLPGSSRKRQRRPQLEPQMMKPRKLDFDPEIEDANDMLAFQFEPDHKTPTVTPVRPREHPFLSLLKQRLNGHSTESSTESTTTTESSLISKNLDVPTESPLSNSTTVTLENLKNSTENVSTIDIDVGESLQEKKVQDGLTLSVHEIPQRQDMMVGQENEEDNRFHLNVGLVANTNNSHPPPPPPPTSLDNTLPSTSLPKESHDDKEEKKPTASQDKKQISSTSSPTTWSPAPTTSDYTATLTPSTPYDDHTSSEETIKIVKSDDILKNEDAAVGTILNPFYFEKTTPSYTSVGYIDRNPFHEIWNFLSHLIEWIFGLEEVEKEDSSLELEDWNEDEPDTGARYGILGPAPSAGVIGAGILLALYVYGRTWSYVIPRPWAWFGVIPSWLTTTPAPPPSLISARDHSSSWPNINTEESEHPWPSLDFDDETNLYRMYPSYDNFQIQEDPFESSVDSGGNLRFPLRKKIFPGAKKSNSNQFTQASSNRFYTFFK